MGAGLRAAGDPARGSASPFRENFPYGVQWAPVIYIVTLRLSMIHFGRKRLAEVVTYHCTNPEFAEALATVMERDVCARRQEIALRRVHDGERVFQKFGLEW